jgi:hypothetical protein
MDPQAKPTTPDLVPSYTDSWAQPGALTDRRNMPYAWLAAEGFGCGGSCGGGLR